MTETYVLAGALAVFGAVALLRTWRRENRGNRRDSGGYSSRDWGDGGDGYGDDGGGGCGGGCGGGGGDRPTLDDVVRSAASSP